MIFVHLGAGAGDLDERANFRCGFTEFIKKNVKLEDKIFVLDQGQIIDQGNHDDLIKKSIIYKNFYEKQLRKD